MKYFNQNKKHSTSIYEVFSSNLHIRNLYKKKSPKHLLDNYKTAYEEKKVLGNLVRCCSTFFWITWNKRCGIELTKFLRKIFRTLYFSIIVTSNSYAERYCLLFFYTWGGNKPRRFSMGFRSGLWLGQDITSAFSLLKNLLLI